MAAGEQFVVGLDNEGRVHADGHNGNLQLKTEHWKNVVSIDAGWSFTVGLTEDGELLFAGLDRGQAEEFEAEKDKWKNVVNISANGGLYGENPRGGGHTVGLRKDGTVVAVGDNSHGQCDVENWEDIVKVAAGNWYTVGLKEDGTIEITGDNYPGTRYIEEEIMTECTDIVDIAAGYGQTLCLKSDGTIISFGFNDGNKCEGPRDWTNLLIPEY